MSTLIIAHRQFPSFFPYFICTFVKILDSKGLGIIKNLVYYLDNAVTSSVCFTVWSDVSLNAMYSCYGEN